MIQQKPISCVSTNARLPSLGCEIHKSQLLPQQLQYFTAIVFKYSRQRILNPSDWRLTEIVNPRLSLKLRNQ